MAKTLTKFIVTLMLTGAMLACSGTEDPIPSGGGGPISGVWFETAYAEWQAASADAVFSAKIRLNEGEWQDVDEELVRVIDKAGNKWRVDVPGLRNTADTSYDLRILDADGNEAHLFTDLVPVPFDRQGYAFTENAATGVTTTTGGYKADGTVADDAEIVYVTHETMNGVLASGRFNNNTVPVIIRFIGKVGLQNDRSGDKETIQSAIVPRACNGSNMYSISTANNITIEGVGNDAYLEGWGLSISGSNNVVVRNLKFDWWYDDAVYINNTNNSWITHNTFGYGVNRYAAGLGEADHVKGDGATDVGNTSALFTISYNIYNGSGKSMLIGGGTGAQIGHGSVHHNWFNATSERTPRLRNGWVHVFNNIYDHVGGEPGGGMGYGIAAGNRSNIVSEGNTFIHTYRPYIISGEMSSNSAGDNIDGSANTLSGDAPGVIITSLAKDASDLAGRTLEPDVLDAWSKGEGQPDTVKPWYYESELTLENGPTFTNNRRSNGRTHTYTFVKFDVATSFRTDGSDGSSAEGSYGPSPNATFPARAPINATLTGGLGVETAANGEARVRQYAGVMK